MTHAIESLSIVHVLVVSVVGFLLGALWFSPLLFVKAWLAEMKWTPEMIAGFQKEPGSKLMLPKCFVWTVLSTFTLASLLALNRTDEGLKGVELGLFVGIGLVASRESVNGMFERKSVRHRLISSGHDVALFALQGAILAVWR